MPTASCILFYAQLISRGEGGQARRSSGSNNSEWLRLYAVTGRGDDEIVTSVTVCATLSFSDGIDKVKLRLLGTDSKRWETV